MSRDYILTVFLTTITIVDPIGIIPVYLPIASRFPVNKHNKIILMSITIATIVASCFLFAGNLLFKYLGIRFESIYIVGGILLFLVGLDMIYARPRRTRSSPEEQEEAMTFTDVSVFPLAIPMLSGPGTIATTMMFGSRANSLSNYLIVFSALMFSFIVCAVVMKFSSILLKLFGQTGLNVLDRVMGIILCSLAVQFVINAVTTVVKGW